MLQKNDIAGLTLGRLGVSLTVSDVDVENSNQAKVLRRTFRMALDTFLQMHEWGFATKTEALAVLENDPTASWLYSYQLPADCVAPRIIAEDGMFPQVKQYEDEKEKFKVMYNGAGAAKIYSNVRNAHLEYTVRLAEDFTFPVHFARGLSARWALDVAPMLITQNFAKVEALLLKRCQADMNNAIAIDLSMEPQLLDSPNPFIRARW